METQEVIEALLEAWPIATDIELTEKMAWLENKGFIFTYTNQSFGYLCAAITEKGIILLENTGYAKRLADQLHDLTDKGRQLKAKIEERKHGRANEVSNQNRPGWGTW